MLVTTQDVSVMDVISDSQKSVIEVRSGFTEDESLEVRTKTHWPNVINVTHN